MLLHLSAASIVERCELRPQLTPLWPGCGLSGEAPPAQNLRHVGHADTQQGGDFANRLAIIRLGKDPLPKVLRIRLSPPPQHAASGQTNRRPRNHTSHPFRKTRFQSPRTRSSTRNRFVMNKAGSAARFTDVPSTNCVGNPVKVEIATRWADHLPAFPPTISHRA